MQDAAARHGRRNVPIAPVLAEFVPRRDSQPVAMGGDRLDFGPPVRSMPPPGAGSREPRSGGLRGREAPGAEHGRPRDPSEEARTRASASAVPPPARTFLRTHSTPGLIGFHFPDALAPRLLHTPFST